MPRATRIAERRDVGILEQCERYICPSCKLSDTYGRVPIGGVCVCVCGRHFKPHLDAMGLRDDAKPGSVGS